MASAAEKPAPQPSDGLSDGAQETSNAGDATMIFLVGMGHFLGLIFRVSLLAYFFWTGVMYVVGGTLLVIGFQTQSPMISNVPACPAKQSAYFVTALWYLLGVVALGTAYGYTRVESMSRDEFENVTGSLQVMGFLTKIVPTWTRLVHVFTLCQLNIITVQTLFLPECNSTALVGIVVGALVVWWLVIFFGVWAKSAIYIPAFLYEPPKPGNSFVRELHAMMRALGP